MVKTKYLLKVRRSRKKYIPIYLMIGIIIALIIYFSVYKEYKLDKFVWILSGVFVYITIKIPEYEILKDWWAVTDTKLVQSLGLFSKNIREVDFSSISDIDLDQSLYKRILNYGNVNVRLFLNDTSICIRDINKPQKFMRELQEIISERRKNKNAIREL